MLPSFVHDIRTKKLVDVLEGDNSTVVYAGLACTYSPLTRQELESEAAIMVQSEGSFFFKNVAGQLPVITEDNVIRDTEGGQLYVVVSAMPQAAQQDTLRCMVRAIPNV